MDNEYNVDYEAILRTVRTADVLVFRFITVPQRLLIDNRTSEVDAPLVKLVPKAASAEERFKSLKVLRPRFKLPEKISAIWWPRYIKTMRESGLSDEITRRIAEAGFPAAARECEDVLDELARMERAEVAKAIGGDGYRTLWPARAR